ncbi:MAG: HAMP domain-containing protein [bacterium]
MSLGLRQKLSLFVVAMALLIVGALYIVSQTTVRWTLEEKLSRQAVFIGQQLASGSESGILGREHVRLSLQLRELVRGVKGVEYAYLLDPNGVVIVHSFEGGFPAGLARANPIPAGATESIRPVRTGRGDLLDAAVPILEGRLGSAHVGMSETLVERDVNEVLRTILPVSAGIIAVMAVVSILIGSTATKPILELARLARKVEEGHFDARAEIRSRDEVGQLAAAFNSMNEVRREHDRERERLVTELQEALDNVKTLSGFLPICSHCKKVRDSQGYWNAIEQYISEHSEAQFSHGICDECMEKLYPEYGPRKDR